MTNKLNAIKSQIETLIRKETGSVIEWTITGDGFTVSGSPEAVEAAKPWFASHKLESIHHDEELCESFAYYK